MNQASRESPRELVATASRVLAANGHDDYIWGHAALRDPAGRGIWMKASGIGFDEVTPERTVLVDFNGNLIEGDGPRHVEWPIHTEVMAARPEITGTVHSHPPHALALGASRQPLRPVSHAGTLFAPPDVPRFERTANLIVTRELGDQVSEDLKTNHAMLLVNHGIVTTGEDLRHAVARAILLEDACRQQLLTAGFGGIPKWSSDEEALAKRETIWTPATLISLWDHLVRKLR